LSPTGQKVGVKKFFCSHHFQNRGAAPDWRVASLVYCT